MSHVANNDSGMKQESEVLGAFGKALRKERLIRGLSQEELALKAGLDRTYVGGVERGERNLSLYNIWKLAHALGVTPAAFFTESQE